jgi:hypothetical protein
VSIAVERGLPIEPSADAEAMLRRLPSLGAGVSLFLFALAHICKALEVILL